MRSRRSFSDGGSFAEFSLDITPVLNRALFFLVEFLPVAAL